MDLDEWLATKTVEIFDELNLLAGCIQHFCTPERCPRMCAGKTYEWKWAVGDGEPVALSAPGYFRACLLWADEKINDTDLFPIDPGVPFPPVFRRNVSVILKRFFRMYAHVYYSHFQQLMEHGADAHLNYNFKHFLYVCREFDLVSLQEMEPLQEMVEGFLRERDQTLRQAREQGMIK